MIASKRNGGVMDQIETRQDWYSDALFLPRCHLSHLSFWRYVASKLIPKIRIEHNVKSNLIWRKYGPWWLYRAIAINPGASRHTKTWSSRLVGIYRKIPNGSHAQTEPDRTIFPKVSISLLDLWLYGSYFAVNSGTKRLKHTFFHVAWLNEVPWW